MTDLQAQLVKFVKEFDAFCQSNDIEYCLFWGTLLGCIREKGFIPWDDDIDVAMDRENFEKFKKLAFENKLPSHFAFEDTHFLKGCRIPKVRNKDTEILDRNGGTGIFIDIFPFDRFTDVDVRILKIASLGLRIRDYRRKISNKFLRLIYTPLSLLPYLCFVFVRKIYSNKNLSKGDYVGNAPIMNTEYFFHVDDFYPFERKVFESIELPVPQGFDNILKTRYGDYMVPVNYNNKHY